MATTTWEIGTFSTVTGLNYAFASSARTQGFLPVPVSVTWDSAITSYKIIIFFYREDDTYIKSSNQEFLTSPAENITPPADATKIRIVTQRTPTAQVITDEILASIQTSYNIDTGEQPPVDPPVEALVSAKSVKSGLWSDSATWGGLVDENTIVEVSEGHTVTVSENVVNASKVTVKGTLSINEGFEFLLGNTAESKSCEFLLDGGTVIGLGALVTRNGSISSTETSWSYIRDITIKASGTSTENGDFFYDLKNCSIVTDKTVSFGQATARGKTLTYEKSISFDNCVFKNCENIYLGSAGANKAKSWSLNKVTFINVTQIEGSTGTISDGFDVAFDKVVAYHSTATTNWRLLTADAVHSIKNSYLMNQFMDSIGSRQVVVDSCYIGTMYSGVILSTHQDSAITNSILHQPSEINTNNQSIRLANGSYNFVESWAFGNSNLVIHNENAYQSLNWRHNVFIGRGDSFTNINDTLVTDSFVNNTSYLENNTLYITERRYPLVGSTITIKNNLVVDVADNGVPLCKQSNYGGTSGTVNLTVDYNAQYNQSGLFGDGSATLVNTVEGINNITSNPNFIDSTRSVLTWGSTKNLANIEAIWLYFVGANGYDEATEAHTKATHSTTEIAEMKSWLDYGYTPQNTTLMTAGENGTYIGAVMPVEDVSPSSGGYYWCGAGKSAVKVENIVFVK